MNKRLGFAVCAATLLAVAQPLQAQTLSEQVHALFDEKDTSYVKSFVVLEGFENPIDLKVSALPEGGIGLAVREWPYDESRHFDDLNMDDHLDPTVVEEQLVEIEFGGRSAQHVLVGQTRSPVEFNRLYLNALRLARDALEALR